jgi:hypothetical protein
MVSWGRSESAARIGLSVRQLSWRRNGDPCARRILTTACHLLQQRAAKISHEEERRSYLENVASHREIVLEWQMRRAERTNDEWNVGGLECPGQAC